MAIKKAQYNVTKASGEDIYHFQTDDAMVKILDKNNNELGTLKELGFTGKVVNGGTFKNIKVSGNYTVKSLTGLPAGFPTDKISILSVDSSGEVGDPDLIIYRLYGQSGESYQNTVTKTTESGWTEAGVTLKNSLTTIRNQIGTLSSLKTNVKTSAVGAINEVQTTVSSHTSTLSTHASKITTLESHNHDTKYIKRDGDQNVGTISLQRGKALSGNISTGGTANIAGFSTNNEITLGDKAVNVKLYGKNAKLTYNDRSVWTETNMGSGSGLDADTLDGIDSISFPLLNKDNTYTQPQRFSKEVLLNSSGGANRILYKNAKGEEVTGIKFNDAGQTILQLKDSAQDIIVESNGNIVTWSNITISSETQWAGMRFRRWSTQKGKGFELDRNTQKLVLHDWDSDKGGFSFGSDGVVEFSNAPKIQGNKLSIQANAPTGATKGDVWIDI